MFIKKDVHELQQNVFTEIGKNWMLISAKNPEGKVNTMTASWGAMGAAMMIASIPTIILYLCFSDKIENSLTVGGAVKG